MSGTSLPSASLDGSTSSFLPLSTITTVRTIFTTNIAPRTTLSTVLLTETQTTIFTPTVPLADPAIFTSAIASATAQVRSLRDTKFIIILSIVGSTFILLCFVLILLLVWLRRLRRLRDEKIRETKGGSGTEQISKPLRPVETSLFAGRQSQSTDAPRPGTKFGPEIVPLEQTQTSPLGSTFDFEAFGSPKETNAPTRSSKDKIITPTTPKTPTKPPNRPKRSASTPFIGQEYENKLFRMAPGTPKTTREEVPTTQSPRIPTWTEIAKIREGVPRIEIMPSTPVSVRDFAEKEAGDSEGESSRRTREPRFIEEEFGSSAKFQQALRATTSSSQLQQRRTKSEREQDDGYEWPMVGDQSVSGRDQSRGLGIVDSSWVNKDRGGGETGFFGRDSLQGRYRREEILPGTTTRASSGVFPDVGDTKDLQSEK